MKAKSKRMWYVSPQAIDDQPVFTGNEEYPSCMDRFIGGTLNCAAKHIEVRRRNAFEQATVGERTFRFATAIRNLVQIVNANGVVSRRALEVMTPLSLIFGVSETSGIDD